MPYELSLWPHFQRLCGNKKIALNMNQMSFLACTWRLSCVSKLGLYFEANYKDIVQKFCPEQNFYEIVTVKLRENAYFKPAYTLWIVTVVLLIPSKLRP